MRQLKGKKKKDKFASLKPLQTWNFLPPCSVLVLDMDMASPASQLQQFGSSFTAVAPVPTWIMEGISSTTTGALGACCAHTGEGSWVSPRPKVPPAASQSLEPGPGNADSSPEAALAGPHDPDHPAQAPGQRTSRTWIYRCPLLHTCHLFCSLSCARGGGGRTPAGESMTQCSPTPSHAVK